MHVQLVRVQQWQGNSAHVTCACAAGAPVLMSSPFQHQLGQLRMERLRLEESHLLEVKRQDELERMRTPLPKWSV